MPGPDPAGAYFDRAAAAYRDERYGAGADPWRAYFFRARLALAVEMLSSVRGRLLDVGSGPGVLRDALRGAGVEVFQVDLSSGMLARAGGPRAVADARRLPFPDGSMDAVAALGLTTYLESVGPFLAEARRVLAPGGRLLVSFTRRTAPDTITRALFRRAFGRLVPGRGLLGSGLRVRACSEGEALRVLGAAGFRVLETRTHNHTVFPASYLFRRTSVRLGRALETRAPRLARRIATDLVVLAEARAGAARRPRPRRVTRVIARLNVGGPARQAMLLTERLDRDGFETTLVTGSVEPHEADFLPEALRRGLRPVVLEGLGRAISPLDDLRAFLALLVLLLRERPAIVHTHTAKAGTLGRLAAVLAGARVRIHTFHGHVLHGYFGRLGSALTRTAEIVLSRLSTRIVAVSEEVKRDLCRRHRVVPADRVDVVPLGLDLDPLLAIGSRGGALRRGLGIGPDEIIVGVVGRITAVKEPGLALEVARRVPGARFVFVGGGDLAEATRRRAGELGLGDRVVFAGWRSELVPVLADIDLALLTSRNEGTPVALIEAAAAGVPAVATRVGGVPSVVLDGVTGLLAPAGDAGALAAAVRALAEDGERRAAMGRAAREHVRDRFSATRLLRDIERLYLLSLAGRSVR